MAISSKAIMNILALSGEERQIMTEALQDESITTAQALAEKLEKSGREEPGKQCQGDQQQVEALKKIPAGVWAAHVLDEHDDLIYNLALIRDAAKETAATNGNASNVEGHYTLLLEAVDGIVEKFLNCTAGSRYLDVIRLLASKTKKPSERKEKPSKMAYDYSKLLDRIEEKFGELGAFAEAMNLSEQLLSLKLNNHLFFDHEEISKACDMLEIDDGSVQQYFFTLKAQGEE